MEGLPEVTKQIVKDYHMRFSGESLNEYRWFTANGIRFFMPKRCALEIEVVYTQMTDEFTIPDFALLALQYLYDHTINGETYTSYLKSLNNPEDIYAALDL